MLKNKTNILHYLSNVTLHHTNGINQNVPRQTLDLPSKCGTEQKSCERSVG